jgi:hypothetical protein
MSAVAPPPSTALFGVCIGASPLESIGAGAAGEIGGRDELTAEQSLVAAAIHQQAWPILTGAVANTAERPRPWSVVLSKQLLSGKQVYRPAQSRARWLHLTRLALTPESRTTLQEALQACAARKPAKTRALSSPSDGGGGSPSHIAAARQAATRRPKQKKRKSAELDEADGEESLTEPSRRRVEWVLKGSFGEGKETELARLRPEQGEVELPLNVFVPIRTSSVSAPLRLWLQRYPQALIRLVHRDDASPLDHIDLSVEASGELVMFAPGERQMVEARATRHLAQAEQEERDQDLRAQLALWQADDSDSEDRASKRDMAFWLSTDGPANPPQALLALLLEYTKDYTLMLDPDWLHTGRAPGASPAGILLRYLFQPYSDVSRRVLLKHGLCCKFKLSLDAGSSTPRTQFYLLALSAQADPRMAAGMPAGIIELAR